MIISTGLSSIKEIEKTINIARANGANEIALLYQYSYPAKMSDFNLNNITILKNKFKNAPGLSDHSQMMMWQKLQFHLVQKLLKNI